MSNRTRLIRLSLFITVWLLGFLIADHVIEFDSIYWAWSLGTQLEQYQIALVISTKVRANDARSTYEV